VRGLAGLFHHAADFTPLRIVDVPERAAPAGSLLHFDVDNLQLGNSRFHAGGTFPRLSEELHFTLRRLIARELILY
jgi:hypothetical protein